MPSVSGRAPPESPVPAPRGTTLTFSASQKRRMAATCSVVVGRTTAMGSAR